MLKSKIFHFLAKKGETIDEFLKDSNAHDKAINEFIEQMSKYGHTFINMNSVAYGRFGETNRIRTIIIYLENPTRKVIVEKIKIHYGN